MLLYKTTHVTFAYFEHQKFRLHAAHECDICRVYGWQFIVHIPWHPRMVLSYWSIYTHLPRHPVLILNGWPMDVLWPTGDLLVHIPGHPGMVFNDWLVTYGCPFTYFVSFSVHIPWHLGLVLSDWYTHVLWPIGNLFSKHTWASRVSSQWLTYRCPLTYL